MQTGLRHPCASAESLDFPLKPCRAMKVNGTVFTGFLDMRRVCCLMSWFMIPKWCFEIRGRAPSTVSILLGLVPLALLAFFWWFLTRGIPEERALGPTILPSPAEVAQSLGDLLSASDQDNRSLLDHIGLSVRRVALGFFLGLAVALPIGILMGAFGSARSTLAPIMTASGYIPIATLVPLTMSWFGLDESQKVVFLAMAFIIFLLPMVLRAIESVPDVYLRTAYTLGASRWHIIRRVLVPVALPDIWHSMRLAFGIGWSYLVLAEVVVKTGGLGDLIDTARRRAMSGRVYLVIVIITLIAWIADLLWVRIGTLIFPYRRSRS
jgi:NitT/TauT family transport system permease protein